MNIRTWLINKLAGERLVILNATIIYKYYHIFADPLKDNIIEKNIILKTDSIVPFNICANHLCNIINNELKIKDEYLEVYNNLMLELTNKISKDE